MAWRYGMLNDLALRWVGRDQARLGILAPWLAGSGVIMPTAVGIILLPFSGGQDAYAILMIHADNIVSLFDDWLMINILLKIDDNWRLAIED